MTSAAKAALRAELLARRRGLTAAHRAAAASRLRRVAAGVPELRGARVVAAYVAVGDEPDTAPLLAGLRAAGQRVVLPVGAGGWAFDDGPRSLGRWSIPEPGGAPVDLDGIDVLLVPALAVDRSGNRLGRGAGFYDRALAGAPAPAFAVLYDGEVRTALPVEAHDVPVRGALTPAGLLRWR